MAPEQQEDKVKTENNQKSKEITVNLGQLLEKVKKETIAEMKKDFVSLAYRVMAVELCVYKLINEKVPSEYEQDILKQEDFLSANVETLLNRLKEIEAKVQEEREKLKTANKTNPTKKGAKK